MSADLVDRLTAVATEAIRNEAPELAREPERLRGVVLDLKINNLGVVTDGTLYVERKVRAGGGRR